MAENITFGLTLSKKLLPEVPKGSYKKVYKIFEKSWEQGTSKRGIKRSVTWITNIAFILYEAVETKESWTRRDLVDIDDLRRFTGEFLGDLTWFSVLYSVIKTCFKTYPEGEDEEEEDIKVSKKYYRFLQPGSYFGGEERLCYPGGPTNRRNKHIYH